MSHPTDLDGPTNIACPHAHASPADPHLDLLGLFGPGAAVLLDGEGRVRVVERDDPEREFGL